MTFTFRTSKGRAGYPTRSLIYTLTAAHSMTWQTDHRACLLLLTPSLRNTLCRCFCCLLSRPPSESVPWVATLDSVHPVWSVFHSKSQVALWVWDQKHQRTSWHLDKDALNVTQKTHTNTATASADHTAVVSQCPLLVAQILGKTNWNEMYKTIRNFWIIQTFMQKYPSAQWCCFYTHSKTFHFFTADQTF